MITRDSRAQIVDFGLARLAPPQPDGLHLIEKYRRVADDTLEYEITILPAILRGARAQEAAPRR